MALSKIALGALIDFKVNALTDAEKTQSLAVWTAVADAVIQHFKDEAEIASLTQSGIVVVGSATVSAQGATVPAKGKIS
jgi:CRISPR/Cas system endoribonuclease Cas6 (RAMP superfamily)